MARPSWISGKLRSGAALWTGRVVAAAAILLLAVAVLVVSSGYRAGSAVYPMLVSGILGIASIINLVMLLRQRPRQIGADPTAVPTGKTDREPDEVSEGGTSLMPVGKGAIYLSAIVVFLLSLSVLPFPVAAALLGIVVLRLVYQQSWRATMVGALFMSLATSGVFMALGVTLPGPGL